MRRKTKPGVELHEQLLQTFEMVAVEFARVAVDGGTEMILSPRLASYLRDLLAEQPDDCAADILDMLTPEEDRLADVIPLVPRGKTAVQDPDPTSFEFWYGEHLAE